MTITRRLGFALLAMSVAAGIAFVGGRAADGDDLEPLGPGQVTVELRVEHSRFTPDRVVVRPGTTVQFVIVNTDPIDHEFIVGPTEVHERHESGTEATHPPVPGEVSVPAGAEAGTFYTFDGATTMLFACHLPGHFAFGMRGTVEVVAG